MADGFQLSGTFGQPVYWYMLWRDTRGAMEITLAGDASMKMEFPAAGVFGIKPNYPAGVHLLLLVASARALSEGGQELLRELSSLSPPPDSRFQVWTNHSEAASVAPRWRGAGEVLSVETPMAYLKQCEAHLPTGCQALAAMFLRIE